MAFLPTWLQQSQGALCNLPSGDSLVRGSCQHRAASPRRRLIMVGGQPGSTNKEMFWSKMLADLCGSDPLANSRVSLGLFIYKMGLIMSVTSVT